MGGDGGFGDGEIGIWEKDMEYRMELLGRGKAESVNVVKRKYEKAIGKNALIRPLCKGKIEGEFKFKNIQNGCGVDTLYTIDQLKYYSVSCIMYFI